MRGKMRHIDLADHGATMSKDPAQTARMEKDAGSDTGRETFEEGR